jgi:hypothetical protein
MKLLQVSVIVMMLGMTCLSAQNRLHSIQNFRGSVDGSLLLPSTLNLGQHKAQWSSSGQYWFGNSFVSNKGIYQFFDNNSDIVRPDFNRAIDNMDVSNVFGMGLETHTGGAIQVPIAHNNVNFSFGWAEHVGMNWNFSRNMLSLFWKGNKQWAGEKVRLTPFAVNALWYREFYVGSAMEVFRHNDLYVRAGARMKFLQGIAGFHMPKAIIDLTTASDGQYLLFEYDYDLRYALNNKNFSPFRPNGGGTAIDLGFTVGFMKKFQVDMGLVDLGGINFKSNSSTVSKTSSFRYEGLDMNQLIGVSSTIYLDSLYKSLGFDAPQPGKFRMNLGSRLILQGMYEVGNESDLKDKGRVFLTYIQGFQERPFSTRRTYLGAGYAVAALKWLELGTNLGFGGFNRYAFGMLMGLKLGKKFTMAISSENILGTFIPGMASGVDIGGNAVWNFGRYKH